MKMAKPNEDVNGRRMGARLVAGALVVRSRYFKSNQFRRTRRTDARRQDFLRVSRTS